LSKSISGHCALIVSSVRAAVRIANWSAWAAVPR